jgi:hypothetical protein
MKAKNLFFHRCVQHIFILQSVLFIAYVINMFLLVVSFQAIEFLICNHFGHYVEI